MKYSEFFGSYMTTMAMPVGAQFKFVVNGKHKVSKLYPVIKVVRTSR